MILSVPQAFVLCASCNSIPISWWCEHYPHTICTHGAVERRDVQSQRIFDGTGSQSTSVDSSCDVASLKTRKTPALPAHTQNMDQLFICPPGRQYAGLKAVRASELLNQLLWFVVLYSYHVQNPGRRQETVQLGQESVDNNSSILASCPSRGYTVN